MENIYRNIESMDKSNNNNINNNIENSMEKIIFENYCKNLDLINNHSASIILLYISILY